LEFKFQLAAAAAAAAAKNPAALKVKSGFQKRISVVKKKRWRRIEYVFDEALARPENERSAFLDEACQNDAQLRAEVESLLAEARREENLLSDPAFSAGMMLLAKRSSSLSGGQLIGAYKIVKSLGSGGMGEVYLAEDTRLPRFVAIKVLPSFLADDRSGDAGESIKARLRREALAVSSVSHPNVAHIYEIGVEAGERPFMAIEYVEGKTLRELLSSSGGGDGGKVDVITAVDIGLQIASALTAAHAAGVVHRDIKPENVIVRNDGYVKVLDFGLAEFAGMRVAESGTPNEKNENLREWPQNNPQSATRNTNLNRAGIAMGTINYMSPEQARGLATDARTDIWSLGVVLYEMLAGRKPFAGANSVEIRADILNREIERIENIPAEQELLNAVVAKCLEKDLSRRYQAARDLVKDLKRAKRKIEAGLLASNKSSAGAFDAARLSVGSTSQTSSRNSLETNSADYQSQASFSKNARRGMFWAAVSLAVLLLAALPFGFVALARFFSAGQPSETERAQPVQLFTPETKPEGEVLNVNLSPDGRFIVFHVYNDGTSEIFVRLTAGGELAKITDGKSEDYAPVWSPDGARIAFLSATSSSGGEETGIRTISYLGGRSLSLTPLAPSEAARARLTKWSNDGKRIFFESAGGELKTIELDSGQINEIESARFEGAKNFKVSPDEQRIVFTTVENAKEQIWTKPLAANGPATKITEGAYRNLSPTWFPDSRRVAFSSDRSGDFQIFIADIAGKNLKQVTFNNHNSYSPIVSPDGGLIYYQSAVNFDNN
jgi:eukaryotic-like serine/threonine-protein kinase